MTRLVVVGSAVLIAISSGCAGKAEKDEAAGAEVTNKTCAHVVEVVGKTVEDTAVLDEVKTGCEASLTAVERRHASLTACILAAGSADEIDACELPAQRYDSVLGAVGPNGRAVCEHLMNVIKTELGGAAKSLGDEEPKDFLEKCVKDIEKEKRKIGAEQFRKRAKCVLAAQKMEELVKCDDADEG